MDEKIPLYSQLESVICRKIESGEYQYGAPIPSERKLAETYGISRLTVRQALSNLVDQGMVVKIPRKGVFVELPRFKRTIYTLTSFSAMLKEQGIEHRDQLIFTGKVQAGFRLSSTFGTEKGTWYYRICRLRLGNNYPISFEDSFIPYDLIENIEGIDFETSSLYSLFSDRGIKIKACKQLLAVVKLSTFHAEMLQLPPGSPAYMSTFHTYDTKENLVEYTVAYNNPDQYVYMAELK